MRQNTNGEAKGAPKAEDEGDDLIPELEDLDNLLDKYQYLGTSVPVQGEQYLKTSLPASEAHNLGTSISVSEGQYIATSDPGEQYLGSNHLLLDDAAKFEMEMQVRALKINQIPYKFLSLHLNTIGVWRIWGGGIPCDAKGRSLSR